MTSFSAAGKAKIKKAFAAIRRQKITARYRHEERESCDCDCCSEDRPAVFTTPEHDSYVYFQGAGVEKAENEKVGEIAVKALKEAGLQVTWSGSERDAIRLAE